MVLTIIGVIVLILMIIEIRDVYNQTK